ncbi:MAG: 4Fe-4S dicluster domain-containing protein, partial [Deltaproteobacteria bacterium]|nr:4Fe-4S dicluster domain-containing protein [Deltaproteobacteria bacterium]
KPVFNLELCSACNECVQVCPVSCIDVSLQKQKNTTVYPYLEDEKACISCGFCEEACMLDAVNF